MNVESKRSFLRALFTAVPARDLLKIILALALMVFVFSKTNLQNLIVLKDVLSWPWLWISLVFFCFVTITKGLQYWALLGVSISFRETLKIVIIQNALTNFVTNTAGIASYMTMFRLEQNVRLRRSGLVFILTKAGDLLAMVCFLVLSLFQVWSGVEPLHETVVVVVVIVSAGLLIFWTAVFLRQRFVLQFRKLIHLIRLDQVGLVRRGLDMLDALADQQQTTIVRALFKGTVLSLLYMTLTMAYSYARFQIFHIPVDFWEIIFITTIMQFVSIIPIQIFGGLGVAELTLIYLFSLFGTGQVDIAAILVALRVLFYLFNLAVMIYIPMDVFLNKRKLSANNSVG